MMPTVTGRFQPTPSPLSANCAGRELISLVLPPASRRRVSLTRVNLLAAAFGSWNRISTARALFDRRPGVIERWLETDYSSLEAFRMFSIRTPDRRQNHKDRQTQ